MLYGLEDYAYDEFGLKKKNKINKKKFLLIILVVLICTFLVYIVISNFSDNNEHLEFKNIQDVSKENSDNNEENKKVDLGFYKKNNNKESGKLEVYSGNHMQIPNHNIDNLKATLMLPQFNENGYNEVRDIYFSEEKQVYLTFDDGPSRNITPQILDILKENEVKATFFVLGARVDLYPQILKRTFDEGHYIANHGYSHKYSKIYESKDTVFQEYVECENSIRNAIGNQDFNSYLFRFPGGSSGGKYESIKSEAREHFKNYGISYTNWNCLTGDAEGSNTKEECIQEMLETKEGRTSLVLLMHDSNDKIQTVESLPEIIQYLKNEGYTFKTFYDIF